jgi:hypothetical protein
MEKDYTEIKKFGENIYRGMRQRLHGISDRGPENDDAAYIYRFRVFRRSFGPWNGTADSKERF